MNNLECRKSGKARSGRRSGFTLMELVVVVVVVLAVVVLFLLPSLGRSPHGTRQIKDSTQVRGIHQGLVMFAQNNQDRYPLPSLLDKEGTTITGEPAAKDTTANIMSVMIYNGFFGPELCVSPAEANGMIKQMAMYAYDKPASAADPAKALWDPAFSADFTGGRTSNFSYAHMLPSGARLEDWMNDFSASKAAVGNRGPLVTSAARDRKGGLSPVMNKASNTLLIHGGRKTWEGNIAYNDNHVNFEVSMMPGQLVSPSTPGREDCLFFDELDDVSGRNAFLGVYAKAGGTPADFVTIWD